MNDDTRYTELKQRLSEVWDLGKAGGLLAWDQQTMMPPRGAAVRAEQLGTLAKVIHERFVSPEIGRLLGHGRETPPARRLLRAEQGYYRHITPPDVIVVLMVDPQVAVRRKTTEPPDYVRARARIIWETDWTGTGAHLVDAGRPLPEVVADLKVLVWSEV